MDSPVPLLRLIAEGNFDAVLVLADWLDDRGDGRGKLLRRRWKMHLSEIEYVPRLVEKYKPRGIVVDIGVRWFTASGFSDAERFEFFTAMRSECDRRMKDYVYRKFVKESAGRLTRGS